MVLSLLLSNPAITFTVLLIACTVWVLRDERDKSRQVLWLGLFSTLVYLGVFDVFMAKANSLLHWKYDYYLASLDRAMGVSSGAVALAFQGAWPVFKAIYGLMLPAMVLWLFINRRTNATIVRGYAAELIVGPMLYALLPGGGPAYAFEQTWTQNPVVDAKLIRLESAPINAFPSLHLATALLFVLTARSRLWRGFAIIFFVATAVATITTGEHYVIDLVAGLTFGCFLASAGNLRIRRGMAYLAMTLAWSIGIRFGMDFLIAHPLIVRLSAVLTMMVAFHAVWAEWSAGTGVPMGQESARAPMEVPFPASARLTKTTEIASRTRS